MDIKYFEVWCDSAVSLIKYKPDRLKVKQELYDHMEDKYLSLTKEGMMLRDAEKKVIAEMGNSHEIAKELAKIHKPYLGYILRFTRILLALLVICLIPKLTDYWENFDISDQDSYNVGYDEFEDSYHESEHGYGKCLMQLRPNVSDSSDGFEFTVTRVARWYSRYDWNDDFGVREYDDLVLEVKVKGVAPWEEPPYSVFENMYAVDSLGNYYYSSRESMYSNEPAIRGNTHRSGYFEYTYRGWAEDFVSQDAQWLELRYDRDGRDIALRIDLEGGEPQ